MQTGENFCDEIEAWILEYALKHNYIPVLEELAQCHRHLDSSNFNPLDTVRLSLAVFPRLALSSKIACVEEALRLARALYSACPETVAVRHRTKVVLGLRIRVILLAIENELPLSQIEELILEHFQCPDSQENNMHETVFEVSKSGVLAFTNLVCAYVKDPTRALRRKILDDYSVVSLSNRSFRKVIETFAAKYIEQLTVDLKGAEPHDFDTSLDRVLHVCNFLSAETGDGRNFNLNETVLLRILNQVHVERKKVDQDVEADSLLQFFCTAPDN